ncbi:putative AAA family ATPase [Rosellinia necatrix]|uniref:Putative AAA family ATPase n=1 Tax=Rosellinia necatrix TaxID=77044 RepID=A0A1S7UNV0_ROSNE|nr:putative AAA family ATPase [Rosellinia necatrix]
MRTELRRSSALPSTELEAASSSAPDSEGLKPPLLEVENDPGGSRDSAVLTDSDDASKSSGSSGFDEIIDDLEYYFDRLSDEDLIHAVRLYAGENADISSLDPPVELSGSQQLTLFEFLIDRSRLASASQNAITSTVPTTSSEAGSDGDLHAPRPLQILLHLAERARRLAALESLPNYRREGIETLGFWNHTTISRDQTSGSDFVKEVLLSAALPTEKQGSFLSGATGDFRDVVRGELIYLLGRYFTDIISDQDIGAATGLPERQELHHPVCSTPICISPPPVPALPFSYRPGIQGWHTAYNSIPGLQHIPPSRLPGRETEVSQPRDPPQGGSRIESPGMSPSLGSRGIVFNGEPSSSRLDPQGLSGTMARDVVPESSLHYLRERIGLLEAENRTFRESHGQPIRIETLHSIDEGLAQRSTFLDEPTWAIGPRGEAMLKAHFPIPDKFGYLRQQHDIAFVIIKTYGVQEKREEVAAAYREKKPLPRPQPAAEEIFLQSTEMIDAVQAFLNLQPKLATEFPHFNARSPMSAPYLFWYCYRSVTALDGLSAPHSDTMKVLTSWIDEHYGELYSRVEDQLNRGVTSAETVQFLCRPGDVLLWEDDNDTVAGIITFWPVNISRPSLKPDSRDITRQGGFNPDNTTLKWEWRLGTWQYCYNGSFQRDYVRANVILKSNSFTEEVPIAKLSAYPLKYASDDIKSRLQLRGETFWRCRFRRLVSYKGENGLVGAGERYMIDFETYRQLHSDSANFKRLYANRMGQEANEMDPEVMASDDPPAAPEIYVFPQRATGYNLRSKKWDDLVVDLIEDVVWNKKSFEHLVVDIETKELIQALVTNQLESEQGTDIIERKGNGLIILLHGGPGTGKTFTAESVAEMAEKPLFRVTCGDIGTKPEVVENNEL